ncbi:MAG: Lactaldehyde reductase [Lentisphaerae bacterium ADurb.BinA184]|nr:MAG: Lactaldehyde reductase [Lentisphaerae bacterium ADurb.BinA184]
MAYELLYPPRIRFGWGCLDDLADAWRLAPGAARVFLVCTRSFADSANYGRLEARCPGGRLAGWHVGVPPDPPLAAVDAIIAEAREAGADAVVAVGGGSVIDAAKAAAALVPVAGATVRPYFDGEREIAGPGLPLIALPTTAGTGAEVTRNAVLTDSAGPAKKSLRSPFMVPRAAWVDPELTVTLPPALTAASGLDALTQAVESSLSTAAHAASLALAAEAVRLLLAALPGAYAQGGDRAARTAVAEGSLLSGMAFSQSGLGAVHGLAHPIGARLGLAHGFTCAVLLPHVLAFNAPVCGERLARLAAAAGCGTAEGFVAAVASLCRTLDIPADFRGCGLTPEHVPAIVAGCRSASMKTNPRPMPDDEVRQLLGRLGGFSHGGHQA